jgi:hypothetical protein
MWEVIQPDGSISSGNNWSPQPPGQHHHGDDSPPDVTNAKPQA